VACGYWPGHYVHFHSLAHQPWSAVEGAAELRKEEDRCLPLLVLSIAVENSYRNCAGEMCDDNITAAEEGLDFAECTFKPKFGIAERDGNLAELLTLL